MKNNIHIFKRTKSELLIGKYSNKFLLLSWCLYFLYEEFLITNFNQVKVAISLVLPIMLAACIFNMAIFWRFAYQITFDLDDMKVTFFMYKKKTPIQIDISEIDHFLMGLYVSVTIAQKRIFYIGYDNLDLIEFLEKNNIPVKWNKVGKFLTKKMRMK